MGKYFLSALLIIVFNLSSFAYTSSGDSTLKFFPEGRLFPRLFLDPLECQIMGGSYLLSRKDNDLSLYSTVNLGFNRPVLGKQGKCIIWEVNFGAAVFSQFDLIRKDDGSYLAGLLNSDFKLSGDYTIQKKNNLLRMRIFHLSSHLGDDYLQRNADTLLNDKSENYEQADITFLKKLGKSYYYAGSGVIYTKNVFRKRFSLQVGGVLEFRERGSVNFFTAADVKLLAENNYTPDIRTSFGMCINRKSEPLLRIWAEYYSGYLPYSTIDYGRVNWFGLSMAISII